MKNIVKPLLITSLLTSASFAFAHKNACVIHQAHENFIDQAILAPLNDFNQKAKKLDASIGDNCAVKLDEIEANYKSAVLAWMPLQAMRFDAFDQDNRALRAYFWPNSRGYKQIRKILPKGVVSKLEYDKFSKTSVAVQGLTMLEWFLKHKESPFIANKEGQKAFSCQYMDAISTNMVKLSDELIKTYSIGGDDRKMLLNPSASNATYAEEKEVTLQFFKAIHAMSELVMGQKLNRPIATELKNMRPKRLELWRSELTLPNIEQNIKAIKLGIEAFDPIFSQNQEGIDVALAIHADIRNVEKKITSLPKPIYAALSGDQKDQYWQEMRELIGLMQKLTQNLAENGTRILGIPLGFNALDGD